MQYITINGLPSDYLSIMDRGLHYGDGLFETIACVAGNLQFWDEHIERLRNGAERLLMDVSAVDGFKQEVTSLLNKNAIHNCVVKLILTRGQSERGYRSALPQKNTRIVMFSDLPAYPDNYHTQGIKACFCQHPISKNAKLAGIKHLNRLDNVLARNEWRDEYQEGIMLDDSGHVIEGTMSNIFFIKNKKLYTPALNFSGVDGVIRGQTLSIAKQQSIEIELADFTKDAIENMDEIFVCNSVIGIWPVTSLAEKSYELGTITKLLMKNLKQRMNA